MWGNQKNARNGLEAWISFGWKYTPVNAYEMRFVFPSDANRRVGILFRFCTKWSLYTNVGIYCETVTYNCVLKRSETLFKGRHRHSFREIDNTELHNTCNLSTTTRKSLLGRVERGLEKRFCYRREKNNMKKPLLCFVRVNVLVKHCLIEIARVSTPRTRWDQTN